MITLNSTIIDRMKNELGSIKTAKAEKAVAEKRVKIESIDLGWDLDTAFITAYVMSTSSMKYNVRIRLGLGEENFLYSHSCLCQPYSYRECEHILAVLMEFYSNPYYINIINEKIEAERKAAEKRTFNRIIESFGSSEEIYNTPENAISATNSNIEIIPVLKKNKNSNYELGFKIGEGKMYKIKNIEEFYKNYSNGNTYKYGENLAFKHTEENFSKNSLDFLKFILKYGQAISYGNYALENKNTHTGSKITSANLLLNGEILDDFFTILKKKPTLIELEGKKSVLKFTESEEIIKFNIDKTPTDEYKISLNRNDIKVLYGANKIYTISENNVYEYDMKKYKDVFKLVGMFNSAEKNEFTVDEEGFVRFANKVLPSIRENVEIENLPEDIVEKFIPKKLGVKVYLDVTEKGNVLATVKFCYDDIEFGPYEKNTPNVPRDTVAERKVLYHFITDGFIYSTNYESFVLKQEEKIYEFITNGINLYMEKYEVLISEEFKKKEIRHPKISSLGVRIQNDLLNIDLSGLDFDASELKDVLQNYKLRKKYHRLKNGEFLSLEQNDDLDFIENLAEGMEIDYKLLSNGKIKMPVNRSLYLNKLLGNMKDTVITEDKAYKDIIVNTENGKIDDEVIIPEELEATLRSYQKVGYKWLKVLDKYRFGGVLADDMGLRKDTSSNSSYTRK